MDILEIDSDLIDYRDISSSENGLFSNLQDVVMDDEFQIDTSYLQAPNANDFTNARLIEELEGRKLRPSGFRDKDIIVLQDVINIEFEQQKACLIQSCIEKREQAVKDAAMKRYRSLLAKQLQEEAQEILKDENLACWLNLIKENVTPTTVHISLNSISARALSKAMWKNTSLLCLNLSRNALDDFAGAYIAKLVKRNSVLQKLELGSNILGSKTCQALGEALECNSTLSYLSLDSNPLTTIEVSGFNRLIKALESSTSLTALILSRCTLNIESGRTLAEGMHKNSSLTLLELTHTGITLCDTKLIVDKLKANIMQKCTIQDEALKEQDNQRRELMKECEFQERLDKEREMQDWLRKQREDRTEMRRQAEVEKFENATEEASEKAKQEAEIVEEKRKQAEAAALKKAKKGSKKKK